MPLEAAVVLGDGVGSARLGVSVVLMGRNGGGGCDCEDRIGSELVAEEVVGRRHGGFGDGGGRGLQEGLVDDDDDDALSRGFVIDF